MDGVEKLVQQSSATANNYQRQKGGITVSVAASAAAPDGVPDGIFELAPPKGRAHGSDTLLAALPA